MTIINEIKMQDRFLGGLWGSLVGDALGVPVEFRDRATVQADPVKDLRGFGTHHQPPGTWSDDSSLLLCSVDSLVRHGFEIEDMGRRFAAWHRAALWTPHGKVFDVGVATARALDRIASGALAEEAGNVEPSSNGNGSLMRILPVSLWFAASPISGLLNPVHRASSITHGHPRSQMGCGFFSLMIRELLQGRGTADSLARAQAAFRSFYEPGPWWPAESEPFKGLLTGELARTPESEIESSGYVLHTLTASLWCLLTTTSFEDCVLKAVNLGGDTDTTGCVAGALAGVCYGVEALPEKWIRAMARHDQVEGLFQEFSHRLIFQK